jgi:HAD superfamily 5'-nucleotidase-like hydrolase
LTHDERKSTYHNDKINLSLDRYEWIDTLFGLPDACMYTTLVDWYDATKPAHKVSYEQLFIDIRTAIDEAHRDDTLKSVIKADLAAYIVKDPLLAETLHKFRSSGKKLFLLTNSLFDYTDVVMRYLLDGERKAYPSWRNYFDIVIVGGAKPAFFNERRPFIQIDPQTNLPLPVEVKGLLRDRIYQGGNVIDFQETTRIRGDNVLYIGDHIYGDILRLRKQHMWRTAMVLQELEQEIKIGDRLEGQISDLDLLDRRRRNLESEQDFAAMRLKRIQRLIDEGAGSTPERRAKLDDAKRQTKQSLDSLRSRLALMTEEVDLLDDRIDRVFNPHWGSILREGNENSRFGEQVNDYADLYTSRVSNFGSYSPLRYFRAPRRPMPHEM